MAKRITRTVMAYQTESNGVIMNHFTMKSAMEHIKTGASYLGEKEFFTVHGY